MTLEAIEEAELDAVAKEELRSLINRMKNSNSPRYGDKLKVFFLSAPDSPDTIELTQDIKNDLRNQAGRPFAFVQNQRYVALSALQKNPATTTELLTKLS